LSRVLAIDVALLASVEAEITAAEKALEEVLADTPAGVLTSLPGVAVVRASNYGAGIGDPSRFANAAGAYRASGLVPALYQSSKTTRPGLHISREGSVGLRQAIIDLGRGLVRHEPEFAAYRQQLLDRDKKPAVASVAVGHRAHRLAFAMMRDQSTYQPEQWSKAVAAGKTAMAKTARPTRTT
jgi:transposase